MSLFKSGLLAAVLATQVAPVRAADDENTALTIIAVRMVEVDNKGTVVGGSGYADFQLMDLKTKETYKVPFRHNSTLMPYFIHMKPGIYCFYSLSIGSANPTTPFCDEPYFKIEAGTVNNLGLWRFGIDWSTWKIRQLGAIEHADAIYENARKFRPSEFPPEEDASAPQSASAPQTATR
ncbi:hypothetical protein [Silvimonas iriomotensis]|uniref:Uncharacterized protein n=1 Tax=Silvimonas iriomotensis TaxID=449662 RepID=A0ABQ2P4D9_9NEIS|nr:hypothetical protein [Silvimonas iriomotensis]GGP17816.1 hypothetical protein GCM10010970_01690 [Silvimonas iriomotensis]